MAENLLKILAVIVTSIPMGLSLAHALELPGKYRLDRDSYLAMQSVYYPGFTIGGVAEPLSILIVLALLLTQPHALALWLEILALIALVVMHAIFWTVTQPAKSILADRGQFERTRRELFCGRARGARRLDGLA